MYLYLICWIIYLALLTILYSVWLRDWQMNWGANEEEIKSYMPGDELSSDPEFNATRVVEINATPEEVWPWLVQMGGGRAGFYGFDILDNGGISSADRIIQELQDLNVGDSILPLLKVIEIEPARYMLWRFSEGAGGWENATWSWQLNETENHTTRLISRLRKEYNTDSLIELGMYRFQEITEIFMMRTCLLGIKKRVESWEENRKNIF